MLFWIFVATLIFGIVLGKIYDRTHNHKLYWTGDAGDIMIYAGIIGTAVSVVIMMLTLGAPEADVAVYNERYESLVYQYENDIYENDNDLGKRELMADIQEWNEDLAMNRELQDNFWIGIYIPNIYDRFEFIELDKTSATQPSN